MGELDAVFVGLGREVLAAVLAAVVLLVLRERPPRRDQIPRLALTAFGVVVGWPLLSALALRGVTAAEGAVVVGLLPMATAIVASLRAGETPSPRSGRRPGWGWSPCWPSRPCRGPACRAARTS